MSKAIKETRVDSVYALEPWVCTHFGDLSEIDAYIVGTGKWETIANVQAVEGIDAEDIADFIVRAVNNQAKMNGFVSELVSVLEQLVSSNGKPASQEIRRAKDLCQRFRLGLL